MTTQQEPGSTDATRRDDGPIPDLRAVYRDLDLAAFLHRADGWMVGLAVTAFALVAIGIVGGVAFLTVDAPLGVGRFEQLLIAVAPGSAALGILGVLTWLALGAAPSRARRRRR